MGNYRVCVYAICKNEAKFARRWMDSMSEADHIVVLENGHVAEQGTPAELMERGGLYRRMVELQSESARWKLNSEA